MGHSLLAVTKGILRGLERIPGTMKMNGSTVERERDAQEVAEIERHKYFLSEKAGHDVGWHFAEQDWEAHHGQDFRRSRQIDELRRPEKGLSGQGIGMLFKRLFSPR